MGCARGEVEKEGVKGEEGEEGVFRTLLLLKKKRFFFLSFILRRRKKRRCFSSSSLFLFLEQLTCLLLRFFPNIAMSAPAHNELASRMMALEAENKELRAQVKRKRERERERNRSMRFFFLFFDAPRPSPPSSSLPPRPASPDGLRGTFSR